MSSMQETSWLTITRPGPGEGPGVGATVEAEVGAAGPDGRCSIWPVSFPSRSGELGKEYCQQSSWPWIM